MKKFLSVLFAVLLVVSMTTVVTAEDTKLAIASIDFPDNPDVDAIPRSGTLDLLINGDATTAVAHETAGIVLFMNKKSTEAGVYTEFDIVLELEEAGVVGGLDIDFYVQYMAMIGLPKDNTIIVEKSNDGTAFVPAETLTFEGEAVSGEDGVQHKTIMFDEAFEAKFLKLTFAYGDSPFTTDAKVIWEFVAFTEFAVLEGEIADDVSEEPADESEEESKSPDTGDNGYISFAVIAVVSLAGAAIIARKKRA
ncbi:MAG: LPXTG cell wall anchor domain-containing protein [Eubacteriales bacterium]|nr:LPXTG cell wall anchor domain-containing protein [Eubacteriales bacterium]MDD4475440.1 LPXTG cell wall anchor domain-containing protein [Eubacteriales bacterium]